MEKILILIFVLVSVLQSNAQITSYPTYYFGDGTNKPFDKEFDLMIPMKQRDSIYYIYLYKHKCSKSLEKSLGKEKDSIPHVKLKHSWEKSKTGDTLFCRVEFRYDSDPKKEYSLLKPAGTYSLIFFKGLTLGSENIMNALRNEYKATSGQISSDGSANETFEAEREKQRKRNKINTYNEDFTLYKTFFTDSLLPLEKKLEDLNDKDYKIKIEGNNINRNCLGDLFKLLNGQGCAPTKVICIDTCKILEIALSLNKINSGNIHPFIKGLSLLKDLEMNQKHLKLDKYVLRKTNVEKSLTDLFEIKDIIMYFQTQSSTTLDCQIQTKCLDEISLYLDKLINELNQSNTRISEIIKLTSKLKNIYIESRLFIDHDIAGINTYIYNFAARNEMAITPVFGYAYYGFQKGFSGFTPYLGFQVNFQGLNRDDPFNQIKRKTIWQRTCFTTAWTLTGIQEENKRFDLFDKSSLITALGFKFSHILMLNAGVLWFKQDNPNILVVSKNIAVTPVLSLSLNLEVEKLLNGFSKLIPLK